MAYADPSQLELYMGEPSLAQCTDDDHLDAPVTPTAAVVTDVLERASGILDGYLQTAGYTVPVTGALVTPALRHHTAAVAAHFAARRRSELRDNQGVAPYRTDYLDAIAWGQKIAEGKITLEGTAPDGGTGPAEADTGGGMVLHAYRGQQRPPPRPRKMRGW